ncbi:hypothetical protein GCM10022223_64770 [Kineosporia mesophila]|uniref:Uncharacterized protein n=1 Tax=Kineosporia mesophila TaxID=566012 RepID=A0ABP7AQ84_9ACTN|nr:hypothetical protein [Kineosporia mesophila]MCD5349269.1 hypothetical protein [Kineosporia mesophila]
MNFSKINRKAAVVGILAIAGIGGGAAYAYPSGVPLTISASAVRVDDSNSTLTVTLGNADPRCSTAVTVNGAPFVTLGPGQTTASGPATTGSGRNRVRARTIDCALKESARSDFVVPNAVLTGPTSAVVKEQVRFSLTGLEPGLDVTVQAVKVGGGATYSDTDISNRRGEAKVRLKFKVKGTYVVTASINGSAVGNSITITVN